MTTYARNVERGFGKLPDTGVSDMPALQLLNPPILLNGGL
jgi:hypothetical protein